MHGFPFHSVARTPTTSVCDVSPWVWRSAFRLFTPLELWPVHLVPCIGIHLHVDLLFIGHGDRALSLMLWFLGLVCRPGVLLAQWLLLLRLLLLLYVVGPPWLVVKVRWLLLLYVGCKRMLDLVRHFSIASLLCAASLEQVFEDLQETTLRWRRLSLLWARPLYLLLMLLWLLLLLLLLPRVKGGLEHLG